MATAVSPWPRRLVNGAVTILVLVALYGVLGFLVLPTLAKPRLEMLATRQLERRATLGRVDFNPFTFRAKLADFALSDRDPQRPFVRFEMLDLDISLASIWHRAPVLDAVHLVRPQVDLTRNADGTYSVDDLTQRPAAKAEEPTPQFSINNIEVDDGTLTLDDRPYRRKIVVSNIGIGIPFLSSIPHDAAIRVTPHVDGALNGTRFGLTSSSTSPFADMADATLELNLDALPLAHYAEYASLPGGVKVTDGALTTRMKVAFVTEKGVARKISVSGAAKVDKLALARKDGSPLAAARSVEASLAKLDWFGRSIAFDRVVVDAPDADVRREADGTLEWARILGAGGKAPPASQAPGRPWSFSVADARLADGTIRVADASVSPAFQVVLSNVGVEGKTIASTGGPGAIGARFDVDDGARFELEGDIDLAGPRARGHFSSRTFHLAKLYPYYASALNLDVRRGTLDLAGDFEAAQDAAAPRFTLTQGSATLTDVETGIRGEKGPLWSAARTDLEAVAFDLAKRDITIDRLALRQGSINIVREANGTLNLERLVGRHETSAPEPRSKQIAAAGGGWNVLIRKYGLERMTANIEDRTSTTPVKLRVSDARLTAENFSNAPGAKSAMDFTARVGSKGRVRVRGSLGRDPLGADVRVDASGIDLVPLRPYFDASTNIVVTGGAVGAKGRLVYATARGGTPRVTYKGDVTVGDFGSLDRPTSQELVRWKTLTLTGVDTATEPFNLAIGAVVMDQFYARVILNADATLNLKQLLVAQAAPAPEAGAKTTAAGVTTKELASASEKGELPVAIGRIEVSNGEVQYSDFFVRPNYNAHLTGVAGSVSALSATQAGTVEVAASVEGTAPVDIRGTINPFARELQLDLTGKATDVDLPPLTPYSVKYAGYGIQKGKLSLEVHYKIDDRKLAATNKLKLDQLTFGERVDSPTATRLPVLLVLSLLKDRNGVINLDLPIQGTLDDPKFSIWRVIVQIFVNLITRAVTAPFAVLGSIAGVGGEQLAYIEFAPGRAELSPAALEKLGTLAKALNDRPGLKLDATGRAFPDVDRDGLRNAALDRALRALKQKALAAEGESAPSLDAIRIDEAEFPKLLEEVYRGTDLPDKPRNIFGIAKKVPPEQMQAMLLASYKVDDAALAALANRRAQAVKEWLAGPGGIPAERVYIVASKISADGVADKGPPTRVDFAIR